MAYIRSQPNVTVEEVQRLSWMNFSATRPVSQQLAYLQAGLLGNIWETLYSTVLATLFAYVIGLPLGIMLVAGEAGRRPPPAPAG